MNICLSRTVRLGIWFALLIVGFNSACGGPEPAETNQPPAATAPPPPAPPTHNVSTGQLTYQAPEGWISEMPISGMRKAQYKLPRAKGDSEDASLVVYYFGPGQGGSVQANLDRWTGQMEQPDGRSSKEKASTKKLTVNGLNVTLLDVPGTYRADMTPGQDAPENKANFFLRAAVIETPDGPYFIKLVGPEKTVAQWDEAFMQFVESAQFK